MAGSPTTGPLAMRQPKEALADPVEARSLSPRAPEGVTPLVRLGEIDGTPLLLHVDRGTVVTLHHDATLSEVADEVAGSADAAAFADALADVGGSVDLDALLGLAEAVSTWKRWRPRELSPGERAHALAVGLGLAPKELAAAIRRDPRAWEWLDVEPALLDAPAGPPPTRSTTPAAPPAKPVRIEAIPRDWRELSRHVAIDLGPKLAEGDLAGLATLTGLEALVVRLPAGVTLPDTLVNLRSLVVWSGGVPSLPALRELVAWSPSALPKSLPALVSLSLQLDEGDLPAALAAASGYPALEVVALHNVWPKKPKLPAAFSKLAKLEHLRRVRFFNTGYAKDTAGLEALRAKLGCEVDAD